MEPSPKRLKTGDSDTPTPNEAGEAPAAPEQPAEARPQQTANGEEQQQPAEAAPAAAAQPNDNSIGDKHPGDAAGVQLRPRRDPAEKKEEEKRHEEEQRARGIAERDQCLAEQARAHLDGMQGPF